jgi:RNA polymerase subunit RPABC4/transcription elongation factor Spt4
LILEKMENLEKRFDEQDAKAAKAAEGAHVHDSPNSPPLAPVQLQQEPKKPQHYTSIDEFCPDCQKRMVAELKPRLEPEIVKDAAQKQREKVKSLKNPVICENCGDVIDREEPSCPTCHGTKARKFSS